MQLGMIGLGRMGANIVRRIMRDGHTAVAYDTNPETVAHRLETYKRETQPLLDYYAATNRLHRVDGTRAPEAIYAEIEKTVTGDK